MLDKAVQSVAAGHGIRITPNLQRLARASLRLPPNYENFVSNDVRAYAIEAEGLHQCAGDAPACDLPALLVIALAHMEWDRSVRHPAGLNEILPLVISTDFEATMARLKRAHAVADTMSVRDQRICVFCAPTPNGFVHGQTARRGELVLKTLRDRKLYTEGATYCADGFAPPINEQTTFGSVCNARRAVGIRALAGRSRRA